MASSSAVEQVTVNHLVGGSIPSLPANLGEIVSTRFVPAHRFTEKIQSVPTDDVFAQITYDVCKAININGLSVVLDKLVEEGLPREIADMFEMQASILRAQILTENNRAHGF